MSNIYENDDEEIEERRTAARILGGMRRAGFDVGTIKKLAKQRGMRVAEYIAEAIDVYELTSNIKNLDPEALAKSLFILDQLDKIMFLRAMRVASLMVELSKVFSSAFVQNLLEMYNQGYQAMMGTQTQPPVREVKPLPVGKEKLQKLSETMIDMMINMLTNMIANIYKLPTQGASSELLKKVRITE